MVNLNLQHLFAQPKMYEVGHCASLTTVTGSDFMLRRSLIQWFVLLDNFRDQGFPTI